MSARDDLKHALKLSAGLPPTAPTESQLDSIIKDIEVIKKTRTPTDADWIEAAHKHVPQGGKYSYGSEDLSDLNYLLIKLQSTSPVNVAKPPSGGAK